jgi:hypothetical protein
MSVESIQGWMRYISIFPPTGKTIKSRKKLKNRRMILFKSNLSFILCNAFTHNLIDVAWHESAKTIFPD